MIALWIAGGAALLYGAERLLEKREEALPAPGRRVETKNRHIHIMELEGAGKTIVMLPGLGTDVPCADFLPLAKRIQRKGFRVLIVEPLGYGFSDGTGAKRSLENVCGEIREALHAYGAQRDYILFGHSASGLTMRWWAAHAGEELAGLIGEDISLPEQFDEPELGGMLPTHGVFAALFTVSRFLGWMGVNRLLAHRSERLKLAAGEDAQELRSYRAAMIRSRRTPVMRLEYQALEENGRAAAAQPLPECPVLLLTASGKGSCESLKLKSGFSWVKAHEKLAQSVSHGKNVVLDGAHYLHYTHADVMAEEIARFF